MKVPKKSLFFFLQAKTHLLETVDSQKMAVGQKKPSVFIQRQKKGLTGHNQKVETKVTECLLQRGSLCRDFCSFYLLFWQADSSL